MESSSSARRCKGDDSASFRLSQDSNTSARTCRNSLRPHCQKTLDFFNVDGAFVCLAHGGFLAAEFVRSGKIWTGHGYTLNFLLPHFEPKRCFLPFKAHFGLFKFGISNGLISVWREPNSQNACSRKTTQPILKCLCLVLRPSRF